MHKVNLTNTEYSALKVLSDYLLFDQRTDKVTFPRFEECIGILTKSQNFSLKDLFMEICGQNRKYLTFPRLIKAYCDYKLNSPDRSTELKNFFAYIFTDTNQTIGRDQNSIVFSTAHNKNRDCLSNVKVYSNPQNEIQGIFFEYDEYFKTELFAPIIDKSNLRLKIDLKLKVLEDFNNDGDIDEEDVRDFITHVFGTHSTKIEFIGFKCSSGKMYYTGNPSLGIPFISGKNESKFHFIKVGLKDTGISFIKPSFIESSTSNFNLNYELEDIDEEFLENNCQPFEDEVYLNQIEDKREYEENVLIPIFDDDEHFEEDEEDCRGDELEDIYSCYSFCSEREDDDSDDDSDEDDELEREHKYEELFGDLDKFLKNQNVNTLTELDDDFANNLTEGRFFNEIDVYFDEDVEVTLNQRKESNLETIAMVNPNISSMPEEKWDRVSVRSLNAASLFNNSKNLEALLLTYRENIGSELEYKKRKEQDILQNKSNFYLKLISKMEKQNGTTIGKKNDPNTNINLKTYSKEDIERLHKKFEEIAGRSIEALRKANEAPEEEPEEIYQTEYYEEDELGNLIKTDEKPEYSALPPKQIVEKWKSFSEYLQRKVVRFGFSAAFGISKAIDILHTVENEFEDNKTHLDTKVRVLKILTRLVEKRKLLKAFVDLGDGYNFIKKKIITQILHTRESKIKKDNMKKESIKESIRRQSQRESMRKSFIESHLHKHNQNKREKQLHNKEKKKQHEKKNASPKKEASSKVVDIQKLSRDIEKMEQRKKELEVLQDEPMRHALSKKLDFYKKQKSLLVDKRVEEMKKKIIKSKTLDVDKLKKDFATKRTMLTEKKNEETKQKNLLKKENLKQLVTLPVTFSELQLPNDIKIYRSQKIVKDVEFTDEIFASKKNSLCPFDENTHSWILPPGIDESDMQDWETFEWQRIDNIFKCQDYQVFFKGVEASDIIQGSIGNCYFLSAIAALCSFPLLVNRLFLFKEKSNDRCYGVYLRINGVWELVLLDDYVPCLGSSNRKRLAFSNANGKEMWVILLEKAWAKINGSYAKTIAGMPAEVFDSICNAYSETTSISPSMKDSIWLKLIEGKSKGYIMTAGTGMAAQSQSSKLDYEAVNLVEGHAYTLLNVQEVSVNGIIVRLVKIRNPWGSGEWSGDWSDNSNKWTSKLKEELLGGSQDDGVFIMSYEDFIKYFVILGICKIHNDYTYSFLKFKKNDTLKPQVSNLKVYKDTKAFLQIHQKNSRFILENGKYIEPSTAFILIVDKEFKYIASACGDTSNVTIETDIPQGDYYLYTDINYRYNSDDKNQLHGYNITTYSENTITLGSESGVDAIELCRKALISYSKSNLTMTNESDLNVYSFKSSFSNFPFSFTTFENKSKAKADIEFTLFPGKGKRTACFFPETNLNKDTISKTILPGETEVVIIIKYKLDSRVETNWKAKTNFSSGELETLTKNEGVSEDLDEDATITQKYYQYEGGYGLILLNKTEDKLKMKLEVENLSYNGSNRSEIIFVIDAEGYKFFDLKIIPNAKNISFSFNLAD